MESVLIAIVFIALGISFGYKCVQAVLFGKLQYWSGFLPIGIISPLFIHLPAGKNSLIKTTQQWWIHLTAGPVFFLLSMCLLASGADMIGLPGTDTINSVLTMGRTDVPPAIRYQKGVGYTFPIFAKAGDTMVKMITKPVFEEENKEHKMVPGEGEATSK